MARKPSSSMPPSLKQSVLGFASTKRTASAANAKGKKKQPARAISSAPTTTSARSSISASDQGTIEIPSSEDEIVEDDDSAYKIATAKDLAQKKKSDAPGPAASVEATSKSLDPQDKDGRWRKHYREVRVKMGTAEPIHAGKQTKVHHILRIFDLSYQYGPCIGVSRLERWERASALGLNPPAEVHEILLTDQGRERDEFSQTVFYGEV